MRTTTFPDKTAQQVQEKQHLSPASLQARHHQRRMTLLIIGSRAGLLMGLLVTWQFVSGPFVNPLFISSPLAIAYQFIDWLRDGTLWFHTSITLEEILLGLFFGTISGILAGFLLGIEPMLDKILDPFVVSIYSIPKVALAPLFILWFGIEIQMKVIFTAVTVFFLIFFNTLAGVREVDQGLIDAVQLMGGRRRDILFKVVIPSATSSVLTGMHIAIPYALIGAVIAEFITSNRGIGYLIDSSASSFNTAGVFAALLVLTIIASILNAIVNILDQKSSRWKTGMSMGKKALH